MNLTPIFEAAIPEMSRRQSATLGDRTSYIGSSDVAGCPRKVYLQKQYPVLPQVSTLLKFARGHAAEWLLEKIFTAAGAVYDTQVEISHPKLPLRCHIDFLFYQPDGLHVVEVKSVSGIPDAPYPQWEDQLQYQLGMLRLQYPKGDISGSVLAVDLNAGEVHQFSGYRPDEETFQYLFSKALHLLDALNGMVEADPCPSLLCGLCSYRGDCPAMAMPVVPLPAEVEMVARKYAELNQTKAAAEKELKSLRQELIDYTGGSFRGRCGELDLSVSTVQPSPSVDAALLKQLFPDVYTQVLKPRYGYQRLEVRRSARQELATAA
ncbi:PD-(D/E)XK nuclease family protein [Geomonas propionica]|uniref:PD-(D/E)XK endonuclease-like domain-containing protein n=1 Tax=Geomonas propionica TaxID=2798582 RepID=A0ABS0YP43_9BACT|nr:PD-(D/E)XK nuclease family protein [Geomonas propionica]MBJ6799751.1 hypothetical protein [Geomonas propionica]